MAMTALTMTANAAEIDGVEITVPAGPGGGYDQLARAVQTGLQDLGLASSLQVVNIPGAGGTIALANFINSNSSGMNLLTTGIGMVGSIITTHAPVTMEQTRPLARMTGEYLTIVVAQDSPLKDMADFAAAYKEDPSKLTLGGFAVGGSDHLLYGSVIQSFGGDVSKMNYIAIGAGGEMLSQVMGGHIATGAGGYNEFSQQIESGTLRILGLAAPERVTGIDAPTMKEQGFDVDLVNWRGFLAPAGISDEDRKLLDTTIAKMVQSADWKKTLSDRGWVDMYLPSDEFSAFVASEQTKVGDLLKTLKIVD
ncbi:C4-dicarboxylate ABC transporter substrate-binding protein [Devosia psychrophila]|uniref:C4-dicarboxylate ABC transporter substrate-binding protein n=2 Tax=Devosia psychrophila TaxID=728005 RepID=A0ABR5DU88_9HYPH|nr:C4-dicarboxylate ABC transporter substrate-binding protein [Devosia psychrophila]